MAERYLDVHLELDPLEVYAQANPERAIAELCRDHAELVCFENGVTLRHSEPVEVYSRSGIHRLTGAAVMVVASRWVVDGRD